jgi:hypothetical protein
MRYLPPTAWATHVDELDEIIDIAAGDEKRETMNVFDCVTFFKRVSATVH